MSEPTACDDARSSSTHLYCDNCDLLVGLDGLHVLSVEREEGGGLVVTVESAPALMGCPECGVLAHSHGRRAVELIDSPCFGRRVRIRWLKRTWSCPEPVCPVGTFTEQDEQVARPRALLTVRACRWAIEQLRREHASIHGLARQLGTSWRTVWRSIRPLLQAAAEDESRFAGVTTLGVDEHVWHHVNPMKRGPKELTGMVDLTRQPDPKNPGKTVVKASPAPPRRSPTSTGPRSDPKSRIDPEVSTRQSGDHSMSQQETNAIRDQLRRLIDNTPNEADRADILLAMVQACYDPTNSRSPQAAASTEKMDPNETKSRASSTRPTTTSTVHGNDNSSVDSESGWLGVGGIT